MPKALHTGPCYIVLGFKRLLWALARILNSQLLLCQDNLLHLDCPYDQVSHCNYGCREVSLFSSQIITAILSMQHSNIYFAICASLKVVSNKCAGTSDFQRARKVSRKRWSTPSLAKANSFNDTLHIFQLNVPSYRLVRHQGTVDIWG